MRPATPAWATEHLLLLGDQIKAGVTIKNGSNFKRVAPESHLTLGPTKSCYLLPFVGTGTVGIMRMAFDPLKDHIRSPEDIERQDETAILVCLEIMPEKVRDSPNQ